MWSTGSTAQPLRLFWALWYSARRYGAFMTKQSRIFREIRRQFPPVSTRGNCRLISRKILDCLVMKAPYRRALYHKAQNNRKGWAVLPVLHMINQFQERPKIA